MTAKLFTAVKAAYLRECSGLVRNNGKCQPVTVDIMAQIVNGRSVDGLALADGTDTKKVIDLMPGYSCGLSSLPRIYKQVARLAGETCEKITVGGAVLNAYGLTDKQLNAKENKKILAALKKYCPAPRKNDSRQPWPYQMGVYHDSRRRCAVWTNARILIVAPWLYNDAAAGHIVAADGTRITDFEGQPAIYPNWAPVVPDMSYKTAKAKKFDVYSVNAAAVAANAASVAAAVKGVKKAKEYFVAARYASEGGIVAFAHAFAPWFALVDGNLYFKNAHTAAVGYIHTAAETGFILFMPMMLEGGTPEKEQKEIARYADNKTIYADTENDIYIKNQLPQAAADSLPLPFLAVCPEVSTPAEPVADAAADVVEAPAEPVAAHCVALAVVPVADAEPAPAPASRDAADTAAETVAQVAELSAAVIRCYYSSMQAQAAPLPPVDAYDVETLTANAAIIRCRRRGRSVLVAVSGSEGINNFSYSDVCLETGSTLAHGCRCGADGGYNKIEAMQAGINAAIKQYFDCADVVADADSQAEQLPEPPAVVTVSAPYPPAPRRRRFAPRLRPVLHRLGRVAAVVLPLLIVALFMGASTDAAPATDAETVAQVIDLPAVTVTAEAVTDAPATPSPVKKLAAPSPVKKAAADAVTLPNQKTVPDIATATAPAADDADSLTTAPAAPLAPASNAAGLTICAGTAWAYTMMNWA